jgi:hypothetical protein
MDLTQLAANAGFSGNDLATAVAIAMAESGGDPGKYNDEKYARGGTPPGKGSYGLWQIYLKKHPEFEGVNLLDPQINAHAAFDVYSREGFHAWTTYTSGKYQAFLPAAAGTADFRAGTPLTIDAATGLPIDENSFRASVAADMVPEDSFGKYLLWGIAGFFALWLFEESV